MRRPKGTWGLKTDNENWNETATVRRTETIARPCFASPDSADANEPKAARERPKKTSNAPLSYSAGHDRQGGCASEVPAVSSRHEAPNCTSGCGDCSRTAAPSGFGSALETWR